MSETVVEPRSVEDLRYPVGKWIIHDHGKHDDDASSH